MCSFARSLVRLFVRMLSVSFWLRIEIRSGCDRLLLFDGCWKIANGALMGELIRPPCRRDIGLAPARWASGGKTLTFEVPSHGLPKSSRVTVTLQLLSLLHLERYGCDEFCVR